MYEYVKIGSDTLVVHSGIEIENGIETVRVMIEEATEDGFKTLMVRVPDYTILKIDRYSKEEVAKLLSFIRVNDTDIFEYARVGGIANA